MRSHPRIEEALFVRCWSCCCTAAVVRWRSPDAPLDAEEVTDERALERGVGMVERHRGVEVLRAKGVIPGDETCSIAGSTVVVLGLIGWSDMLMLLTFVDVNGTVGAQRFALT